MDQTRNDVLFSVLLITSSIAMHRKLVTVILIVGLTFAFADDCAERCLNGQCIDSECICDPCWRGNDCDLLQDKHFPKFFEKQTKIYLQKKHLKKFEKAFFTVSAYDEDMNECENIIKNSRNKSHKISCPCAELSYRISLSYLTNNSETEFDLKWFHLNSTTGELFLTEYHQIKTGHEYHLPEIQVVPYMLFDHGSLYNYQNEFSKLKIVLIVEENLSRLKRQSGSGRKRSKSSNSSDKSGTTPKVMEQFPTSFGLRIASGDANNMQIGNSIHYRLEIALPRASVDLQIEIFTHDSANKIPPALSLYNFTIPGRVPGISFTTPEPKYFLSNLSRNIFDKLLIDFGTIKNTGPDRNSFNIYFSAVLTRVLAKQDAKNVVTIGAEYGKGNFVWVAQSTVTTGSISHAEDIINSNIEWTKSPATVALDSAAQYELSANLEFRSDQLSLEVSRASFEYEPNNLLSLGQVSVTSFGRNYRTMPNAASHFESIRNKTISQFSYARSLLNMGIVTNIGDRSRQFTNNPENILTFQFSVYALNFAENIAKNGTFQVKILLGIRTVWTRTMNITIQERKNERLSSKLIHSEGAFMSYNVSKGGLTQLKVHNDFTEGDGFTDFVLAVEVPRVGNHSLLEPCSGRLLNEESGFNLVYLNELPIKPTISMNESFYRYIFNFGRLHFLHQREGNSFKNNGVMAEIILHVPFLKEIYNGTTLNVNVKSISSTKNMKVTIAKNEVIVYEDLNNNSKAILNINKTVPWNELIINGGYSFDLDIELENNIAFEELKLVARRDNNYYSNNNGTENIKILPELNICKFSLIKIGHGLPCTCVVMEDINKNNTVYKNIQNGNDNNNNNTIIMNYDHATIDFRSISLIHGDIEASKRKILANIVLMAHSTNTNDNIDFEDNQMPFILELIADKNLIASKNLNLSLNSISSLGDNIRNLNPILNVQLLEKSDHFIQPGFTTSVSIEVEIRPNSVGPLMVEVLSDDEELSICGLWIEHIGENMPCINRYTNAEYEKYHDRNNHARLSFMSISNFASNSKRSDERERLENMIRFQAMVRISETAKENKTLQVSIVYGSKDLKIESIINIPVNGSAHQISNFRQPKLFEMKSADGINITRPGIVKLLYFDIELNENSQAPITIMMDSSIEYKVCNSAFIKIGKNYPCYSTGSLKVTGSKFELGMVCNTFLNRANENENLLRLGVTILPTFSSADRSYRVSSMTYIGSTPMNEKQEISMLSSFSSANNFGNSLSNSSLGQKQLFARSLSNYISTMNNPNQKGATVHVEGAGNVGVERITVKIRDHKWISFFVRIPPNTGSELKIKLQGDADETRSMVIFHDLRIVSGGSNIPCPLENGKSEIKLNSTVPTKQTNILQAKLGYFSNFGFSHALNGEDESEKLVDDLLKLEVLLEITDHPSIVEDSIIKISIQTMYGSIGNEIIHQGLMKIYPGFEGEPQPKIDVQMKLRKKIDLLDRGDKLTLLLILKHLPESNAEPINPILRIFAPNFIELVNVESSSTTDLPILVNGTLEGSIDMQFPWLLFSDEVHVNFTIQIDPRNIRGFGHELESLILPYRMLCEHYRSENSYKSPCSSLKHLVLAVKSSECISNLGMKSGEIDLWQLTASTALSKEYGPDKARLNANKFWSPATHRNNGYGEYLQIDFRRKTRLVKILYKAIRGTRRVTAYHLEYSIDDGQIWSRVNNKTMFTFVGENGESTIKFPVEANLYRFVIEETELASNENSKSSAKIRRGSENSNRSKGQYVAVKLELIGCYLESINVNKTKEYAEESQRKWSTHYTDDSRLANRHIAVDPYANIIYLCDQLRNNRQMCYVSTTAGSTWIIVGRSIDNVEGFELASGQFFAVDYNRPAYFQSFNGIAWTPITFDHYNTTVIHSKFRKKSVIPRLHREDIQKLDIKLGAWKANYDGLYYEDVKSPKAIWKGCCGLD